MMTLYVVLLTYDDDIGRGTGSRTNEDDGILVNGEEIVCISCNVIVDVIVSIHNSY